MEFTNPIPYHDAVDKIGSKSIIGSRLNSEQWSLFPVAIQQRAFWSATIEKVRFLQRGRNSIRDFMSGATEDVTGPDGVTRKALKTGSRADFIKQMSEFAVREGMGPLDPKDAGMLKDIRSERRLGLIFDVQTQQAYDYANWKEGQDPDTLNEFPAQRFIRDIEAVRPRPIHQQNEGVVRLKTDLDFWLAMNSPQIGGFGVPWGPWGFGSGMGVEDVDRDEAESLGLISPGDKPQPVEKDFNDHLEASLRGLDADLVQLVKDTLGDLVEINGDTVKWKGDGSSVHAPVPEPADPTTTPQPSDEPPRESATVEEVLEKLGLDKKKTVAPEDMMRLREALKVKNPVAAKDIIRSIEGVSIRTSEFTRGDVVNTVQEFLNFIPPQKVMKLPGLRLEIANEPGANGSYNGKGLVKLSPNLNLPGLKRVGFHELMHWLHMEGGPEFKELIRAHFEARTQGEKVKTLPGYGTRTKGKRDKWYEVYAGRVYPWETMPMGLEVPTRYIEWLTHTPEWMAEHWNNANFRETMLVVLKGLF